MKLDPSIVFMLDQEEASSIANLGSRRVDPTTGNEYNLQLIRLKQRSLIKVLAEAQDDQEKLSQIGFANIPAEIMQVLILNHPEAKPIEVEVLHRLGKAQEDHPDVVK